jgi:Protein of unknown function (DUF3300)
MPAWSNWVKKSCFVVALAVPIALSAAPLPLSAQEQQAQQPEQQLLTQQELEQLVAPIALYPDALLAQVLTASTYPLDVTLAARWSEKNPNLKGTALEQAMEEQPWDPSVKGLASVPQVLAMMNEKLDWTSQLGEAFLAQPDDVQAAIQLLREKAEATGNLKSSKEQRVRRVVATPSPGYVGPPEYIVIEPVEPDYIYVPVYNPTIVFGVGYWSPAYVPFFWHPPWWTVGSAFGFGPSYYVGPALWYNYSWGSRGFGAIQVNTTRYRNFNKTHWGGGKNWKFNAAHHGNVQFKNKNLQKQFGNQVKAVNPNKQFKSGKPNNQLKAGKPNKQFKSGKSNNQFKAGKPNKQFKSGKPNNQLKSATPNKQFKSAKPNNQFKAGKPNKQFKSAKPNNQFKAGKPNKQFKSAKPNNQFKASKPNKQFKASKPNNQLKAAKGGNSGQKKGKKKH